MFSISLKRSVIYTGILIGHRSRDRLNAPTDFVCGFYNVLEILKRP